MNDHINDQLPEDVQLQAFVTLKDENGKEITIPVEGEVSVHQDTVFTADASGN